VCVKATSPDKTATVGSGDNSRTTVRGGSLSGANVVVTAGNNATLQAAHVVATVGCNANRHGSQGCGVRGRGARRLHIEQCKGWGPHEDQTSARSRSDARKGFVAALAA